MGHDKVIEAMQRGNYAAIDARNEANAMYLALTRAAGLLNEGKPEEALRSIQEALRDRGRRERGR